MNKINSTSPITNCWGSAVTSKIPTEEIVVFKGKTGAHYNHHAQITASGKRLYATWSSAIYNEDSPLQRMTYSISDDEGLTWSEPRPVLKEVPHGLHGPVVQTSMGIHSLGGVLVAYCGSYDYTAMGLSHYAIDACEFKSKSGGQFHSDDTHCKILISKDHGETWTQQGRIDGLVPNLGPHRLRSGRLIIPGNALYPYTDDPTGVQGWKVAGLPRLPEGFRDDSEGLWVSKQKRGDDIAYCEGSLFQTDDQVVHMMLRTGIGKLAVVESHDDGKTYSEPMLTEYADSNCRFHFGRLPDGRWFGLTCPAGDRTPMVLAISEDGVSFDRHFILGDENPKPPATPGHHKGGRYGYPSYHISGDNLWVIYTINKEDVAIVRCSLQELR